MSFTIARGATSALVLGALGTLVAWGGAHASGFALPDSSAAGIATTNALVANPEELGAIPYNAAAMGFHGGSSVALGGFVIGPSFSVTTASGKHDSQGADWTFLPSFQAAIKLADPWRLGLGLHVPFGLETRWPYGTFPLLSQQRNLGPVTLPTGNHPTASKLEILDFVPTLAYRVNDNLSLAVGMDVYWAKTAQLDSNLAELSGDGTGFGFNLSAMYRLNAWTLGASFHSASTIDLDGDYTPLNPTMVALGLLQPEQAASLDLDLPWRLQLGLRYEISPTLAAEFDWSHTGWSSFKELEVFGQRSGALIFADTNNWNNASAYRLGLTWQVLPATQLRCGYSYDQAAQDDDYFSARVPDTDRHLFGIGVAQDLGDGFAVEASYLYVMGVDRDYYSSVPYTRTSGVNGTAAINGDYEMSAHLFGIEVSKTF
ncbi:MAG TPA: outer membrane protein transport protein [Chromatiaceae bacterium]|nr:outer membrane protein transport protein [Chromatiaceae bacterium]